MLNNKKHRNNKFYYTVASCWLLLIIYSNFAQYIILSCPPMYHLSSFPAFSTVHFPKYPVYCTNNLPRVNTRSFPRLYKTELLHFPNLSVINPLNPELNPICYLLALLAQHFLRVSRMRVKSLTLRLLMSYIYIYGAPILDVSRSHTTTQHSR